MMNTKANTNRGSVSSRSKGSEGEVETSLCYFSGHLCNREKLPNYEFCLRHILEDKAAPFKQCSYNIKSQKRCQKPAPKADKKDGYCAEHSRKTLMNRHKLIARKRHLELSKRCLEDLSHYKTDVGPTTKVLNLSDGSVVVKEEPMEGPSPLEPEKETKSCLGEGTVNADPFDLLSKTKPCPSVIDDGDEVQDDEDEVCVDQAWRGGADSDAESIDSEMENPLKHAGSYSAEEVIRIMRDKLIRLQKSYIDQFQRLQYLLREERRRYKHRLLWEKETMVSIHKQPKESAAERTAYKMIKSLNHYNRPQGKDAILASKVRQKRMKITDGLTYKDTTAKCSFNITSNTKCHDPCIPLSKYCLKHIMEDSTQVLFRHCGVVTEADDGPCETPIANSFEWSTCLYHMRLQPQYSRANGTHLVNPFNTSQVSHVASFSNDVKTDDLLNNRPIDSSSLDLSNTEKHSITSGNEVNSLTS